MAEPEDHGQAPSALSSSPRGEEEEIMMTRALEGLPDWRTSPSRSGDDEWSARRDQHDQDVADAISKRTRAHYSLADMSLDQLETFLQESDEEDYFQNVDDEEEYRKFLAAVQEKVGAQEDNPMEKVIEESESEDEDADFEVEIEEALESDIEEGLDGVVRKRKRARRPVTREKRRKRESLVRAGFAKAPLRPLLPYAGNERSRFLAGSSAKKLPPYYGFTAHQIGQLYCLMHEHVQLLLQVNAMCILEPGMQQVAMDTRKMLMELVEKREAVLSWKRCAFPDFCFRPPYIHSSVPECQISSLQNLLPERPEVVKSRDGGSSPRVSSSSGSGNAEMSAPLDSKAMDNECASGLALSSSTFSESLPSEWVPAASGPVRSLLDVAPLALVREFTEVVDQIVQASEQQDSLTGILAPAHLRVPLFPVQLEVSQIPKPACGRIKAHSSSNLKRTKAAALVESSKKQSIALVPKDIAVAMERFCPLFNKSLLPHRPSAATAANRLLFTDAEDELLAMGLMTYNNDWKAIQERFLPSKSMHQIFVRQKNRSSAKAPPNSIKAVRRMKSSPLTADEVVCIEEALKVYKYDWNKVCQYCVPHRDPATLPRQWRVALGTQKSYKFSVNSKAKRRLNDARRHQDSAGTPQIYPSVGTGHSEPYEAGGRHCELENTESHGELLCTSPATSQLSSEIPLASNPVRSSGTLIKASKHKVHRSPLTYTSSLKNIQTVKLAPGLPLLKLPPTVRVLSHSDTALSGIPSLRSFNVKVGSEFSANDSISGRFTDQSK